jgi:type III pantothenate kinase
MRLASDALYRGTSQLRRVELVAPDRAIGRSTIASMQSGLVIGYLELVEGMIGRFKSELNPDDPEKCVVIATGGLAGVLTAHTDAFDHVDPDLTLKGLRIVNEQNR